MNFWYLLIWRRVISGQTSSGNGKSGWEKRRMLGWCLIHKDPVDIATARVTVSSWLGAKLQRPPSGTALNQRSVVGSGFSGAFKCFRSCLECRKRLSETEAETGFLIGAKRCRPPSSYHSSLSSSFTTFFMLTLMHVIYLFLFFFYQHLRHQFS